MLLAESDSNFFDAIVPLFAIFCVFGLPVLVWFAGRYMKHRERMAMYRPGPPPPMPPQGGYDPRPAAYATAQAPRMKSSKCDDDLTPEDQLRKGIRLAFIGLAVTIGLSFIGLHSDGWRPGPWLLGGLVPLFIGLSQILNGVLSGASIDFANRGRYGMPPPGAPGMPGANGAPGANGSAYDPYGYTYRPGGTPEIDAPPRPPDRR